MDISSGIYFEQVSDRLRHFINAITERKINLKTSAPLDVGGAVFEYYTDGKSICIPEYVDYIDDREENYMVLLHSVVHECAHIEFDSFRSDSERYWTAARTINKLFPGQFEKNRNMLSQYLTKVAEKLKNMGYSVHSFSMRMDKIPFLTQVLFYCKFPFILRDPWNIVEDNRVNQLLYDKYPGYAKERDRVDAIDFENAVDISELKPLPNLLAAFVQQVCFRKVT